MERNITRFMEKMADANVSALDFCVEEAKTGLCAQKYMAFQITFQAVVDHPSSDAIL